MLPRFASRVYPCGMWVCLALVLGGMQCFHRSGHSFMPRLRSYDEKQKKIIVLPKKLLEISGIHYLPNGNIAAINDEDGLLFFIRLAPDSINKDLDKDSVSTIRFGKKDDYEDIVVVGETFYVIEADGDLHEVTLGPPLRDTTYSFRSEKKTEFESIYHHQESNKLILVTKDHKREENGIYSFSFDLATKQFSKIPYFFIPTRDVYSKLKDNMAECKPSAAAVHPKLNRVFIIASVGKVLMQCTMDGRVERAFEINPAQFPQPEGITFAPNGDMYISNEGLMGKATLIKFPYQDQTIAIK